MSIIYFLLCWFVTQWLFSDTGSRCYFSFPFLFFECFVLLFYFCRFAVHHIPFRIFLFSLQSFEDKIFWAHVWSRACSVPAVSSECGLHSVLFSRHRILLHVPQRADGLLVDIMFTRFPQEHSNYQWKMSNYHKTWFNLWKSTMIMN